MKNNIQDDVQSFFEQFIERINGKPEDGVEHFYLNNFRRIITLPILFFIGKYFLGLVDEFVKKPIGYALAFGSLLLAIFFFYVCFKQLFNRTILASVTKESLVVTINPTINYSQRFSFTFKLLTSHLATLTIPLKNIKSINGNHQGKGSLIIISYFDASGKEQEVITLFNMIEKENDLGRLEDLLNERCSLT